MKTYVAFNETKIPVDVRKGVEEFCSSLQSKLGDGLLSVILYGSGARDDFRANISDINLLVVVEDIGVPTLKKVMNSTLLSRRFIISPLFMTKENLATNTRVFPIKFLAMKDSYLVIHGQDVLKDFDVDRQYLRLRCQQETLNILMRLRRFYLTRTGHGLMDKIAGFSGNFFEVLQRVLSLYQEGKTPSKEETPELAESLMGLDRKLLDRILLLKNSSEFSESQEQAEELYNQILKMLNEIIQKTYQAGKA
jgi:predicted nucleotidyltransferase